MDIWRPGCWVVPRLFKKMITVRGGGVNLMETRCFFLFYFFKHVQVCVIEIIHTTWFRQNSLWGSGKLYLGTEMKSGYRPDVHIEQFLSQQIQQ